MIKYLLFAYCLLNSFYSAFSQSIFKVNNNNKVYFGVDNQVNIISKYNPDQLIVLVNQDTLTYINQSFYYKTFDCELKQVAIKIGLKRKMRKTKWLDSTTYNIEFLIHPPIASSYWAENDSISQERIDIKMTLQLKCGVSDFCNTVCPYAVICSFNFKVLRNDSLLYQEAHNDRRGLFYDDDYFISETNDTIMENIGISRSISWKALNFLTYNSKKEDVILFENVKAILCKKEEVDVNDVRLIIK